MSAYGQSDDSGAGNQPVNQEGYLRWTHMFRVINIFNSTTVKIGWVADLTPAPVNSRQLKSLLLGALQKLFAFVLFVLPRRYGCGGEWETPPSHKDWAQRGLGPKTFSTVHESETREEARLFKVFRAYSSDFADFLTGKQEPSRNWWLIMKRNPRTDVINQKKAVKVLQNKRNKVLLKSIHSLHKFPSSSLIILAILSIWASFSAITLSIILSIRFVRALEVLLIGSSHPPPANIFTVILSFPCCYYQIPSTICWSSLDRRSFRAFVLCFKRAWPLISWCSSWSIAGSLLASGVFPSQSAFASCSVCSPKRIEKRVHIWNPENGNLKGNDAMGGERRFGGIRRKENREKQPRKWSIWRE